MKLNIKVKIHNEQNDTIEIEATDVEQGRILEIKNTLLRIAYDGSIGHATEAPSLSYEPASDMRGAKASQKQINFIRMLGYTGVVDDFTVGDANDLIKKLKQEKGMK